MTAAPLIIQYRFAHSALERNLEGVNDGESLSSPDAGGNCLNWIVGHLLLSRNGVHALVGLNPAWPEGLGASDPYKRGSTGFPRDRAVPLSKLRGALGQSQTAVLAALKQISPEQLAEQATETMTVGERLAFLGFHEGYHVGQTGLLRRVLGKAGAIK
jgi:DinB family protein